MKLVHSLQTQGVVTACVYFFYHFVDILHLFCIPSQAVIFLHVCVAALMYDHA